MRTTASRDARGRAQLNSAMPFTTPVRRCPLPTPRQPVASAASSSSHSSKSPINTEEWSVRTPVTSSRFLTSSVTAIRKYPATPTPTPRSDFLNQYIERDRDQYKEQARKSREQLDRLQDIVRYDVGEPRILGTGSSKRTPILSDDLVAKVTHLQEAYYCAKEEVEAHCLELESLQSTDVNGEMLHEQRIEDDLRGAKVAIAELRSALSLSDDDATSAESLTNSESEASSLDDPQPSPHDLPALVEWQSKKIKKLTMERDLMRSKMEAEKAEGDQLKRDMLITVRVAEQFRKEAESEAKQLRKQLEESMNKQERRFSESSVPAAVKASKESLPIWALLKEEKPLGSRRNAFLEWCKERLSPYGIEVQNFSSHWNDGRAFTGLLHSFSPKYMHPDTINASTAKGNMEYILKVATRLKIPEDKLMSANRLCREKPNWQDVMEFTAQLASALLKNHHPH